MPHRILECECIGMDCPYCDIKGAEKIADAMHAAAEAMRGAIQ